MTKICEPKTTVQTRQHARTAIRHAENRIDISLVHYSLCQPVLLQYLPILHRVHLKYAKTFFYHNFKRCQRISIKLGKCWVYRPMLNNAT